MSRRIKRVLAIFAVNAIVFGLAVGILELLLGGWINPTRFDKLNIITSIDISYDINGLYASPHGTVRYRRDEHGLRGSFGQPSDIALLTVGGSTTDQRYLTEGETWQDVLREEFKAAGMHVPVGNAGIDGQTTYGHIKSFEWWFPQIPGLKPRVILFYTGINDFYPREDPSTQSALRPARSWIRELLEERSFFYTALRRIHGIYLAEYRHEIGHRVVDFSKLEWTVNPRQTSHGILMGNRAKAYAERIKILIDRTRAIDAVPVFATQPARRYRRTNGVVEGVVSTQNYDGKPVNGVDYYHMMRHLDAAMTKTCREAGVLVIDLAGDSDWEDGDFYDFTHMTPQGASKLGRRLFLGLQQMFTPSAGAKDEARER